MVSGVLCLAGLLGVILNNMGVRNIGIVGYAVVLPVVMLLMGRAVRCGPTDDGALSGVQRASLRARRYAWPP